MLRSGAEVDRLIVQEAMGVGNLREALRGAMEKVTAQEREIAFLKKKLAVQDAYMEMLEFNDAQKKIRLRERFRRWLGYRTVQVEAKLRTPYQTDPERRLW